MAMKASDAWKLLHGIVCVYKPSLCSSRFILNKLRDNICRDLNNLELRPPMPYLDVDRSGPEITINVRPSYADNILCSGPRYNNDNIIAHMPTYLGDLASGVSVVCVNGGNAILKILQRLHFTRCYHIKGILGQATENFHINGKVLAKAKYKNVTENHFERTLASYQSALQRRLFEEYGVNLQSQEAYDLAVSGLFRPGGFSAPITYGLKIVELKPPEFVLEVQCIHETEVYLLNLIHNLGVSLKCYATCTEIRCIRQGCFHVEHALTQRQWTLNNLLDNLKLCWKILEKNYRNKIYHSRTVDTKRINS